MSGREPSFFDPQSAALWVWEGTGSERQAPGSLAFTATSWASQAWSVAPLSPRSSEIQRTTCSGGRSRQMVLKGSLEWQTALALGPGRSSDPLLPQMRGWLRGHTALPTVD